MKTKLNKFIAFISNNLWLTFLLNLYSLIDVFSKTYIYFKGDKTNNIMSIFSTLGIDDLIVFTVSIVLYLVLLRYKHLKEELVVFSEEINDAFEETTKNLNHSHRLNSLKISYLSFYTSNKELSTDEYIKALNKEGFSIEELEEIGVDKDFIENNRDKLFPKEVMDSYKKFKKSLISYKTMEDKL